LNNNAAAAARSCCASAWASSIERGRELELPLWALLLVVLLLLLLPELLVPLAAKGVC